MYKIRRETNQFINRWWTYEENGSFYLMVNDNFIAKFNSEDDCELFEQNFSLDKIYKKEE